MGIKETLVTNFPRTMKLSKFVTLESGLRPKGGVGGILDGIPSLGGEHLNTDGGFIFEKIKYIPEDFFEVLSKGHIYPNDIIVVKDGATTGKTSFVGNDFPHKRAVVNEHLFIVRVDPKIAFPKYVFYYLFSNEGQKQILSDFRGATIGGISRNFPQKVNVPIPSIPEQAQIANFLDHKTEQIDELIRIKERQIELLREQRTALINQAVTKGLDPSVEMKPSGLEWIGEIPVHWEVINTKYLFRLVTEPAPKNNDYELLSIYTEIGVKPRKELEARGNRATTTDGYWLVKKGDFIVNKLLAWMGAIGLSNYEGVTSPAYDILRKSRPLNERFYEYLFRCGLYFTEFKKRSRGIMEVRLRLYFDQFGQIPLVFPPVHEQDKITNFLDRKTRQIDELIATEQRKIELLKEYRQSVISEAVTGKIDVRNEV